MDRLSPGWLKLCGCLAFTDSPAVPLLPHFLQSHAIASASASSSAAGASDDWSGWHLGRRRYAVWVLELHALGPAEGEAVRRACAQACQALAAALVPRYERQLHVTLATAGFLDGDAALPDAYGAAELSRDLHALQDLPAAPLQLEFGGWGSFEMAPYLQVRDRSQGGPTLGMLHGALRPARPELALTEALRPYVPHVTLGAWNAAWPRAQVLQWISGLPVLEHWQAAVGEIALVSYAADALHGPLTCHARYDLRGRRLQWRERPGWA
nr:2'-5' RNA ligase family protein [Delftia acidovorans]